MGKESYYNCYILDQFHNRKYLGTIKAKNKTIAKTKFKKKFTRNKLADIEIEKC